MSRKEPPDRPARRPGGSPAPAGIPGDEQEFRPLIDLAPQFGVTAVGIRRMAAADRVPGARRIGNRWVVHMPTLRAHFTAGPGASRPPSSAGRTLRVARRAPGGRLSSNFADLDRLRSAGHSPEATETGD